MAVNGTVAGGQDALTDKKIGWCALCVKRNSPMFTRGQVLAKFSREAILHQVLASERNHELLITARPANRIIGESPRCFRGHREDAALSGDDRAVGPTQ